MHKLLTVETCLSPLLFPARLTWSDYIVVVIDVLRATTAFNAAFDRGFTAIIPVAGTEEALRMQQEGYLVAAERDGEKLDFADFGNSPTGFLSSEIVADKLVYTTTNGTQAIESGKAAGNLIAVSFSNLSAAAEWLERDKKNVLILCAGWKNTYSLEDTLCAGALAEKLSSSALYVVIDDATLAALELWKSAKDDLLTFVSRSSHYQRLLAKNLKDDLAYCFKPDTSKAVPLLVGGQLIDGAR